MTECANLPGLLAGRGQLFACFFFMFTYDWLYYLRRCASDSQKRITKWESGPRDSAFTAQLYAFDLSKRSCFPQSASGRLSAFPVSKSRKQKRKTKRFSPLMHRTGRRMAAVRRLAGSPHPIPVAGLARRTTGS